MATPTRKVDRRIQRTRQVLQQAFKEIVQEKGEAVMGIWGVEKGLLAMSIQDITERANVNRGTFYLHFADKFMLADTIIREQFRQMVTSTLPPHLAGTGGRCICSFKSYWTALNTSIATNITRHPFLLRCLNGPRMRN